MAAVTREVKARQRLRRCRSPRSLHLLRLPWVSSSQASAGWPLPGLSHRDQLPLRGASWFWEVLWCPYFLGLRWPLSHPCRRQ